MKKILVRLDSRRKELLPRIFSCLLIALSAPQWLHAIPLNVLSQEYHVAGEGMNKTSPIPPVVIDVRNRFGGTTYALADGSVGPSEGYLATEVWVTADGSAFATAEAVFQTTGPTVLNLATSGGYFGTTRTGIRLLDLSDNVTVLDFRGHFEGGTWNLTDFFSFDLGPLKDYRLESWSDALSPDGGSAIVFYSIDSEPIPEPSSVVLLIPSLVLLQLVRGRRFVGRQTT